MQILYYDMHISQPWVFFAKFLFCTKREFYNAQQNPLASLNIAPPHTISQYQY